MVMIERCHTMYAPIISMMDAVGVADFCFVSFVSELAAAFLASVFKFSMFGHHVWTGRR